MASWAGPGSALFQSTHPSGVRRLHHGLQSFVRRFQSTHPSGVRPVTIPRRRCRRYFNPRTPVGCDVGRLAGTDATFQFQSTHPSGVRPVSFRRVVVVGIFQSTHPSGVRPVGSAHDLGLALFQSTHPSGVRLACELDVTVQVIISIHAPQWGATNVGIISCMSRIFQSTHPSGVRPKNLTALGVTDTISIHAPQWGAT